jgi:hypothetical protein
VVCAGGIDSDGTYRNSVTFSTNGNSYPTLTSSIAWTGRINPALVAYGSQLFLMGGYNGAYLRDVRHRP